MNSLMVLLLLLLSTCGLANVWRRSSNDDCTADICGICRETFDGVDPQSFNCERKCGLCSLCGFLPFRLPQCDFCVNGIDECTSLCNRGKRTCISCYTFCD